MIEHKGVVMPDIRFSQGPARNGWDGRMWSLLGNVGSNKGLLLANFFDEGLLRRFLEDSWGVAGMGQPIPCQEDK